MPFALMSGRWHVLVCLVFLVVSACDTEVPQAELSGAATSSGVSPWLAAVQQRFVELLPPSSSYFVAVAWHAAGYGVDAIEKRPADNHNTTESELIPGLTSAGDVLPTEDTIRANFEPCSMAPPEPDHFEIKFHSDTDYLLVKEHKGDLQELLAYTNCLLGADVRKIDVYVVPFLQEASEHYPQLLALQVREEWDVAKYGAALKSYYGYTYTNSNVIQIRPSVLETYYTTDPTSGYKSLPIGGFFGQLGHEILHVVLMSVGYPEDDQHCFFYTSRVEEYMLTYLGARKLFPTSMIHTSNLSSERGCHPMDPRRIKRVKREL